jgi:hypothetical protein
MNKLPPLRGSVRQVKWVNVIRANTFADKGSYSVDVLAMAEKVDDATWWIANHESTYQMLVTSPKPPAPHQLVGGPPPPNKTTERVQRLLGESRAGDEPETAGPCPSGAEARNLADVAQRRVAGEYFPKSAAAQRSAEDEPHEAELFAESVCRHPALAQVAVLGLMAKAYLRGKSPETQEVGRVLLFRARQQFGGLRARLVEAIDKDLDGLQRILK